MTKTLPLIVSAALPTEEAATIATLPTSELYRLLEDAMRLTATHLSRMALIIRTLEERGESLAHLKISLLSYLRSIACGQLLPETVVRFAERPLLMRRVGALPLPDQARLARGEPVILLILLEDGRLDHRMADPLSLTAGQVHQVFAPNHLRDEAAQILILEDRRQRAAKKPKVSKARVRPDPQHEGLLVGRSFIAVAEVLEALAQLRNPATEEKEESREAILALKITQKEHERLGHVAIDSHCSVAELVRRALRVAGLI